MCGSLCLQTDLARILSHSISRKSPANTDRQQYLPWSTIIAVVHDNINRLVEFKMASCSMVVKRSICWEQKWSIKGRTIAEKPSFRSSLQKTPLPYRSWRFFSYVAKIGGEEATLFQVLNPEPLSDLPDFMKHGHHRTNKKYIPAPLLPDSCKQTNRPPSMIGCRLLYPKDLEMHRRSPVCIDTRITEEMKMSEVDYFVEAKGKFI